VWIWAQWISFFFKSQEIKNQIGKCARGLFDLIRGDNWSFTFTNIIYCKFYI
jgi:hypothetical protein